MNKSEKIEIEELEPYVDPTTTRTIEELIEKLEIADGQIEKEKYKIINRDEMGNFLDGIAKRVSDRKKSS